MVKRTNFPVSQERSDGNKSSYSPRLNYFMNTRNKYHFPINLDLSNEQSVTTASRQLKNVRIVMRNRRIHAGTIRLTLIGYS